MPRTLDKGRADIAGVVGEYHFACPLDQQFLNYAGIDPKALRQQLELGKGDGEILEWIMANAKHARTEPEIAAWSCWQDNRVTSGVEAREFFHGMHKDIAPNRNDIGTWFDLLDLDDYVSFGGEGVGAFG